MNSKLIILTIMVLLVTLESYAQKNRYTPKYSTVLDVAKGSAVLKQCSRFAPKADYFFKITDQDSILLINNFKKILNEKAAECCFTNAKVKSLSKYLYQYTGLVINNKRYIYINAVSLFGDKPEATSKDWKTEPIMLCDGGTAAWGILFDLTNQSFSQLSFNGFG